MAASHIREVTNGITSMMDYALCFREPIGPILSIPPQVTPRPLPNVLLSRLFPAALALPLVSDALNFQLEHYPDPHRKSYMHSPSCRLYGGPQSQRTLPKISPSARVNPL